MKLWAMFPPTESNLRLFSTVREKVRILERLSPQLEGGFAVVTDHREALFFPAGTLHAVFTLRGNYLVGKTFIHRHTITTWTMYHLLDCSSPMENKQWSKRAMATWEDFNLELFQSRRSTESKRDVSLGVPDFGFLTCVIGLASKKQRLPKSVTGHGQ